MIKKSAIEVILFSISLITFTQTNDSLTSDVFTMDMEQLMSTKVSIATRSEQLLYESPATISVITAEDIKNFGIRQLEDVLDMIPGFELSMTINSYYTVGVRGVRDSRNSTKILVMIDGTPINQVFYGCAIFFGYDINIDNIEKIEIIRGPGSALYGRNAFSAVINIISKKRHGGHNTFIKGGIGNGNSQNFSASYGYKTYDFEAAASLRYLNTNHSDDDYEQPYEVNKNTAVLNTMVRFKKFEFNGIFSNLDYLVNTSYIHHSPAYYSLKYSSNISPNLHYYFKLSGHNASYYEDIELIAPNLTPSFPLGLYVKPQFQEYTYDIESVFNYRTGLNNEFLFGAEAGLLGVYDAIIYSNGDSLSTSAVALPGIGRDNMVLYEPGWVKGNGHKYSNCALFAQDIWKPAEEVIVTLGARFDYDNEFGGQFNPRLGIIYQPHKNGNIKLLYGRAYRAPAPREQYAIFGYAYGNENLKPEVINTFEFAGWYRYKNFTNTINFFWNSLTNVIYAPTGIEINPDFKYHNIGRNYSHGLEYENKFVINKWFQSFFNASYTVSENFVTINDVDSTYSHPNVAPLKINLGFNSKFLKYFSWNASMFYRSEMGKFQATDPATGRLVDVKDPIGNYAIFNTVLRATNLVKRTDLSFAIYNVFDKKYYSQDNQHLHQPTQPGRQILFSLSYTL